MAVGRLTIIAGGSPLWVGIWHRTQLTCAEGQHANHYTNIAKEKSTEECSTTNETTITVQKSHNPPGNYHVSHF